MQHVFALGECCSDRLWKFVVVEPICTQQVPNIMVLSHLRDAQAQMLIKGIGVRIAGHGITTVRQEASLTSRPHACLPCAFYCQSNSISVCPSPTTQGSEHIAPSHVASYA